MHNYNHMTEAMPGQGLNQNKMPGHWLLAQMGKRVLRPGGLELTKSMINALNISRSDDVVEFAPGLGVTTALTLKQQPESYSAIERDEAAANRVRSMLKHEKQKCLIGRAEDTGLPEGLATVVYGEAMLTMQTLATKQRIVQEAFRILQSGGRYGIHELCLVPDDLDNGIKTEIQNNLSDIIHVGARPLTPCEWSALLEKEGFEVKATEITHMHLLEPKRLIQDEGIAGALKFLFNVLRNPQGRERVLTMRRVFRKYKDHLRAIMFVGVKSKES